MKRTVFPSTLWESARAARRTFRLPVEPGRGDTVVLHTTYLAPMVERLQHGGASVAVDAHDLIWRVHQMDANTGPYHLAPVRYAYAATVRPRELRGLRAADTVLLAGWTDRRDLEFATGRKGVWAPTGLPLIHVVREKSATLRVGLIGNFEHSATIQTATDLIGSQLANAPGVELVFAGRASESWEGPSNLEVLGRVESVSDFYGRIDALVVPVANGSGMKTKLAEAALAGTTVVTSPAGAAGYPPELSELFSVFDDANNLDADLVRRSVESTTPTELQARFAARLGEDAAAQIYANALVGLTGSRVS